MIRSRKKTHQSKQKGVGLIEILITIVLLSIGFLAAARMQVEGMRFSQSAYFQSQAYFLASDMINRMRTNRDGVEAGDYDGLVTEDKMQNPGCSAKACTPGQIALQDAYDWGGYFHSRNNETNFIAALPSSDSIKAYAKIETVDNDVYSVVLIWSEIIGGENKEQSLTVNFALAKTT